MATLAELQDRLLRLQDGLTDLRELIDRLGGGGGGDNNDDNNDAGDDAISELTAEIADGLREAQDDCELLQEDAADLALVDGGGGGGGGSSSGGPESTSGLGGAMPAAFSLHASPAPAAVTATTAADRHDRARLTDGLARLKRDIQAQHAAFRTARLRARDARAAAQRAARQQLLASYANAYDSGEEEEEEEEGEEEEKEGEDEGEGADDGRDKQTAHPRPSTKAAARGLVRGLVVAHKSDTWYLQTALYLLVATAAWLLFRRLLYGPLWLLVWWPLRTALGTAVWVGRHAGGSGSSSGNGMSLSSSSIGFVPTASLGVPTSADGAPEMMVHATPSAQADGSSGGNAAQGSGSLVDAVGQIVEGDGDGQAAAAAAGEAQAQGQGQGQGQGNVDEAADRPNPMKRMWEEDVEAAKYAEQQRRAQEEQDKARKKDEL
ncbi:protein transport membrane glycoprotein [Niveomyces insectorum RCEF 264]|uniref:Protein transport membrane glycoprotein n=1 Tax=Niveomyces insectorum RCEF 264 TaxID=1081102 RepID=A0A167U2Q2_9HYPO|nr:protein transport membrane glycoprotein [Niveomyces insectorum RCEF 264]